MKALKLAVAGLAVFTAMSAPVQAENTFAKPLSSGGLIVLI